MVNPNTDPHDAPVDLSVLAAKLDRIERKLDYVVERQRFVEDFIDEMIPVGREALAWGAEILGEAEQQGYVQVALELKQIADRIVETYGPGEVAELGGHIVELLDTFKNVTQPDVLEMANKATDVLHHADEMKPVGMFGVVRATGDQDVQRGMAVALQILKHLGQARGGDAPSRHAPAERAASPVRGQRTGAPRSTDKPAATPTPAPSLDAPRPAAAALHPPAEETVEWMGKRFTPEGFLVDANDWDRDLAGAMAKALGLELGDEHWTVILWAREAYLSGGSSPNVRRGASGSGIGTKRIYELFPNSPGKTTAMLAGIPKPAGCV